MNGMSSILASQPCLAAVLLMAKLEDIPSLVGGSKAWPCMDEKISFLQGTVTTFKSPFI